ncbi:MAG TPA: ABC transporter ATP-binding protein, partial [Stellaceae bacterium]|nr:ABC transporter ATP-binding protein [Stellaceae bacterium]
ETIAGFHRPSAGRIVIGGRDVTNLPPERRRVGLVFQNFSLFPHLTVRENVAIGLRRRPEPLPGGARVPIGDVSDLLGYFGVLPLANRKPGSLSAGEQQRVSLARAFATCPDLLLFDEPFSALDAKTREQLRLDLANFVRSAGIPAIFVTHDYTDALALADRLAVINEGRIVQEDSAADVFERPVNAFVARFVGFENVLSGRIECRIGDVLRIAVADRIIYARCSAEDRIGEAVVACIRAENVTLRLAGTQPTNDAPGVNRLPGRIAAITNLGPLTKVSLDCGFELAAYVMSREVRGGGYVVGVAAEAEFDAASVHLAREV